ncbi:hypothetical protein B0H15DRAFT_951667 [Mycena belliarum]|uniref:Uncharacterized protein n=1 Tax=Mycena belliarum TaxID=1033014 RepID=A0AAD6U176_9AGAR|nr:hypothetical protein B0H15DRAFT_951667 [Mycena belliae]
MAGTPRRSLRRTARLAVWRTPELRNLIASFLNLQTLGRYRGTSKQQAAETVDLIRRRILNYTEPFFPSSPVLTAFFADLVKWEGIIVGSVPLAVVSMPAHLPCPSDLNVVASHRQLERWLGAMARHGFTVVQDGPCSGVYENVGYRFLRMTHAARPGKSVTFTFSARPRPFQLWFAAENTNQLNAITGRTLVCPDVIASTRLLASKGWAFKARDTAAFRAPIRELQTVSPFPGVVQLFDDTGEWGIGQYSWGGWNQDVHASDVLLAALDIDGLRWVTGVNCVNPLCRLDK